MGWNWVGPGGLWSCLLLTCVVVLPGTAYCQSADSLSSRWSGLSLSVSPFEDTAPSPTVPFRSSDITLPGPPAPFDYNLPDAPAPKRVNVQAICTPDNPHARACRYHFRAALQESTVFLFIELGAYLKIDKGTWGVVKSDIENGEFWSDYVKTFNNFRFNHWNDDDTWRTTWIGHPMSGSFVEFIWVQNAPKTAGLQFGKSKAYWKSRLIAMIPSAVYSAQWLIGPVSESSFGNEGRYYYVNHAGKFSNGTGYCDFVVTPIGGLLWSVAEDWADLHFFRKIRVRTNNPAALFAASFITPTKSGANLLRLKAPWYRDPEYSTNSAPNLKPATDETGRSNSRN